MTHIGPKNTVYFLSCPKNNILPDHSSIRVRSTVLLKRSTREDEIGTKATQNATKSLQFQNDPIPETKFKLAIECF